MKTLALLALLSMPAAAAPKSITAELGKTFVLRKAQVAKLKDTDAAVRLAGFINSPCPKGARCIWSGQSVTLELSIAGSTVSWAGAPYQVKVASSDYKTRAALIVTRIAVAP